MKTLSVARKTLLELLREPLLFGLLLLFPALLVGFYYVAFGQTKSGQAAYLSLLVANQDVGAMLPDGTHWQAGAELVTALREAEYDGQAVFKVGTVNDRRAAEISLRERKASLLLIIPADFTRVLIDSAAGATPPPSTAITLVGDQGSDGFVFAQGFLNGLVRQFVKQVTGQQDDTMTIAYEFLPGTGTMSDFDFGVGGIIVFGIMFVIITTATVLVRENVTGTLRRLRLTNASAGNLLIGVTLAQMAAAVIQILITFGTAVALGFQSRGSLLLAMTIGLLLNLSAIGLGLIVACFSRNDGEATNLGSVALVPMVFLSGALFPMPAVPIATIAGRTIQIYDFLPTTHAAEAMRKVLILGGGIGEIWYELAGMTVLSLMILAAGVILYQRLQMRRLTRG